MMKKSKNSTRLLEISSQNLIVFIAYEASKILFKLIITFLEKREKLGTSQFFEP